jgi:hypothetical protein
MPGFTAGMSKCSRGVKAKVRGVPLRRSSTLSFSSAPSGTSGSGGFGRRRRRSARRASSALACFLEPRDLVLAPGDERAETFEFRLVAAGLRGARLLRGKAFARQGSASAAVIFGAPRLVDGKHFCRGACQPPSAHGGVERFRVLADRLDVVHGSRPSGRFRPVGGVYVEQDEGDQSFARST